jgi:bile acid:Na+ symporter, BASS family
VTRAGAWIERRLTLLVLVTGLAGVFWPGPGRLLADHGGVPALLVVLVAATGVTVTPDPDGGLRRSLPRAAAAVAAGGLALPVLAWAVAGLVPDPALHGGVLSVGVAPAEVASVALVGILGGDGAGAAIVLLGSTLVSVALAGPVMAALGGRAAADPVSVLVSLALIVAVPLAAGLLLGRRLRRAGGVAAERWSAGATLAGLVSLLVLVWLVGAQVRLGAAYLRVALALLLFIAGSAGVGLLVAGRTRGPLRAGIVLPLAMRDFAIAAGIATSAFGTAAAGPLGLYGLAVLLLGGAVTARVSRVAAGP